MEPHDHHVDVAHEAHTYAADDPALSDPAFWNTLPGSTTQVDPPPVSEEGGKPVPVPAWVAALIRWLLGGHRRGSDQGNREP